MEAGVTPDASPPTDVQVEQADDCELCRARIGHNHSNHPPADEQRPPLTEEELAEIEERERRRHTSGVVSAPHVDSANDVPRLIADLRAAKEEGRRAWDAGYDAGYKAAVDGHLR